MATAVEAPSAAVDAGSDDARIPIEWAGAGDCLGQLRLLQAAATQGHLDESQEPPFAVAPLAPATSLEWIAAPTVTLVADLPLPSYDDQDAAAGAAPCLLLAEPARDLQEAHRVVGFEDVASVYESSTRSERNPDYDAARARVREAERETRDNGPGILQVGDPLLDLVGLLVGGVIATFGQVTDEDVDEALAELKETPRSRDRPIYRAYEFQRSTVRAGKEATIPVALRDLRRGLVWRAQLRQREMRQFAVLEGLDPRDRDYEQHRAGALSWAEFEHWQRQPPQLALSALVAALVEPEGATGGPQSTEPDLIAKAALSAPAIGPADADVVTPDGPVALPSIATLEPMAGPDGRSIDPDSDRHSSAGPPAESQADTAWPFPDAGGSRGIDQTSDPAAVGAADPRVASVVRLSAGGRQGNGLYVRPRLVVTAAEMVGTASVIDVTTSDGEEVLGLVVLADPARDLALVHVPRAGQPSPLADEPSLGPRRTAEVIELGNVGRARVRSAALSDTPADLALVAHLELEPGERTAVGAPVFLKDGAIGLIADESGGPTRRLIRIDHLENLLASEPVAALQ